MSTTFRFDRGGFNIDQDLDVCFNSGFFHDLMDDLGGGLYAAAPYSPHGDSTGRVAHADLPMLLMHVSQLMANTNLLTREARLDAQPGKMSIHHGARDTDYVVDKLARLQLLITYAYSNQGDVAWA